MSNQRMMVDQSYFPHIVEGILAAASPESLLALRVNKEWRKLAEVRLGYHICLTLRVELLDDGTQREVYRLRAGDRTFLGKFVDVVPNLTPTLIILLHSLPLSPWYLRYTRVLDVFVRNLCPTALAVLTFVPSTVVVRCHSAPPCDRTSAFLPSSMCVVLFDNTIVRYVNTAKLVYHCNTARRVACNGDGTGSCLTAAFGMVEFVNELVVHFDARRWLRSRIGDAIPPHSPVCRYVGLFGDLVLAAHMKGIRTTVVGFDFDRFRPEGVPASQTDLTDALKQLIGAHINGKGTGEVRYLSEEQYATEVGAEQYRIETHAGPIAYPGN